MKTLNRKARAEGWLRGTTIRPLVRRFPYTFVALQLALLVLIMASVWDLSGFDLPGMASLGIDPTEMDAIVIVFLLVILGVVVDHAVTRQRMHELQLQAGRIQVLHATMRTVQDIVSNGLMGLYQFRTEAEPTVSPQSLALFDTIIEEVATKLQAISALQNVRETQMAMGMGIEYQSTPLTEKPAL
jgi:hypothetical protein